MLSFQQTPMELIIMGAAIGILLGAMLLVLLWLALRMMRLEEFVGANLSSATVLTALEAQQRRLLEMDQGLRAEIANGIQSALLKSFNLITEGTAAHTASLAALRDETAQALQNFSQHHSEKLEDLAKSGIEMLLKTQSIFADIQQAVQDASHKTALSIAENQASLSEKLGKELGALTSQNRQSLEALTSRLAETQEQLRSLVAIKLDEMRSGNEQKLDDMRRAVDEKLQTALEKQIGESFRRVTDQFAALQQAIGQVHQVAGQVGDLKRLFSNVKARGGWGAAQAEAILQDMLPEGAYEKNKRLTENSYETVEFAVRIPVRGGTDAWLAIDSKFSTEDYERLLTANELGHREEEAEARAALECRMRVEANRIAAKYIAPPITVDFAILYLPTDSLFAEVARAPGLIDSLRRNSHVMVMGPSLFPAFLHTIKVGYLAVALEHNVTEIGETLAAVKTEWGKLEPWLSKLAEKAESLKSTIEKTQLRARAVGRRLHSVDVIEHARAEAVLGLDTSRHLQEMQDDLLEQETEEATLC